MTTYLSDYAHFTSKDQMDEAAQKHVSAHWDQLNKTDLKLLDMIRRYSVKYQASHLKHSTMEKALEKSNSAIRRSLKKLESLGIIKVVKFIRRILSGMGANIYSILPFKSQNEQGEMNSRKGAEKADISKPEATKSEKEPFSYKSLNNLITNTYSELPEVVQSFYAQFKSAIVSRLGEDFQKLVSRMYGIYKAQSLQLLKFSIYEDKKELFEALAMQSISITLQASKQKTIENIPGFFNGVYYNLISKHLIKIDKS